MVGWLELLNNWINNEIEIQKNAEEWMYTVKGAKVNKEEMAMKISSQIPDFCRVSIFPIGNIEIPDVKWGKASTAYYIRA